MTPPELIWALVAASTSINPEVLNFFSFEGLASFLKMHIEKETFTTAF